MADKIKMLLAVAMLLAGVWGYYHFADQMQVLRVVGLLVVVLVATIVALQTSVGRSSWAFAQAARVEVRKVVWPTRKETMQMTITVIIGVFIMAILLWGFDSFLAWLVKALIG